MTRRRCFTLESGAATAATVIVCLCAAHLRVGVGPVALAGGGGKKAAPSSIEDQLQQAQQMFDAAQVMQGVLRQIPAIPRPLVLVTSALPAGRLLTARHARAVLSRAPSHAL